VALFLTHITARAQRRVLSWMHIIETIEHFELKSSCRSTSNSPFPHKPRHPERSEKPLYWQLHLPLPLYLPLRTLPRSPNIKLIDKPLIRQINQLEASIIMSLRINDLAPDFTAETTQGTIHFHEWIGDKWAVLFSHPKDFTPVCTTELGAVASLESQFAQRGAKVIGLSVDPVEDHLKWEADIKEVSGSAVNFPMIGDPELKVAKLYDMLPADSGETSAGRTPAHNAPVRTVFVVGPDKRIKLMMMYPMTTGRNFDEIIRVLDSMQLTAKHRIATPADWKQGEDVIITGAVSNEEADKIFPGYKTVKPYLRTTSQPQ
jgi:alkyl hydroperoxide reductase subunit AhpC